MNYWRNASSDYVLLTSEIYRAGQRVPAGVYKQVDGSRELQLATDDVLPASCDGRVAIYMRSPLPWAEARH